MDHIIWLGEMGFVVYTMIATWEYACNVKSYRSVRLWLGIVLCAFSLVYHLNRNGFIDYPKAIPTSSSNTA